MKWPAGVYSGNLCERSLQWEPMRRSLQWEHMWTEVTVGTYENGVYSVNLDENGVYSGNLCERSLQWEPMWTRFTVGTYVNAVYSGNLCERSLQLEPMWTEFTVGTYVNAVYSGNLCERRPCMHNVEKRNCLWRNKKMFVETKMFVEKRNCVFDKKFWFLNLSIFLYRCRRPFTFQTMNFVRSNNLSLKYPRDIPSGCTHIGISKFKCVAKAQFLSCYYKSFWFEGYFACFFNIILRKTQFVLSLMRMSYQIKRKYHEDII